MFFLSLESPWDVYYLPPHPISILSSALLDLHFFCWLTYFFFRALYIHTYVFFGVGMGWSTLAGVSEIFKNSNISQPPPPAIYPLRTLGDGVCQGVFRGFLGEYTGAQGHDELWTTTYSVTLLRQPTYQIRFHIYVHANSHEVIQKWTWSGCKVGWIWAQILAIQAWSMCDVGPGQDE
jgi:hypothetical protein